MLAFLGAIICIIASVHPAGTAASSSPPSSSSSSSSADNDSAAAALLPPADKGLGALHGPAEALASAGPRLPGSPPPLFSRFVCTPLSAECPAAAGPEELLALRSAAAQLRRTALEQKERIRMDQETIRELTGKLSRCEGGSRAPPAPAAGLRAAPRPGTMGHPPAEPPAVRELEEAVRALQDRIDRIEVRGGGSGGAGGGSVEVSRCGSAGLRGQSRRRAVVRGHGSCWKEAACVSQGAASRGSIAPGTARCPPRCAGARATCEPSTAWSSRSGPQRPPRCLQGDFGPPRGRAGGFGAGFAPLPPHRSSRPQAGEGGIFGACCPSSSAPASSPSPSASSKAHLPLIPHKAPSPGKGPAGCGGALAHPHPRVPKEHAISGGPSPVGCCAAPRGHPKFPLGWTMEGGRRERGPWLSSVWGAG
uniref:Neuronal pentraxin receptor n=1 Tax=Anser brachyrhynchus TaxID=132585 RepID=A0A8B9B9P3_9AVES